METKRIKPSQIFSALGVVAVLTIIDQLSKYAAAVYLKGKSSIPLIPGVFELTYLENSGAAWGMFENFRWIFLVMTVILSGGIIYVYLKTPQEKSYGFFRILCMVLLSGAFGNAIDRLIHGYVIDFFYISLINFPVFNIADCYVTFSIGLFLIVYRKEVMEWMKKE